MPNKKFSWNHFLIKMTSRKFWALLSAFVTADLILFNVSQDVIAKVIAVIGAFGSVIAYIIMEGMSDKNNNQGGDDDGGQADV